MPHFAKYHVFILPHAEEYRRFYGVSVTDVLSCLNTPEKHEGLADDRYTAEKSFDGHQVYVYYYLTLPLQGRRGEAYTIVDFVGFTSSADLPDKQPRRSSCSS